MVSGNGRCENCLFAGAKKRDRKPVHRDQSSEYCQGGKHFEVWLEGEMVSAQGTIWIGRKSS